MRLGILLSCALTFIFIGCSNILMPYDDEFSCNKGLGQGRCASMSENYEAIQNAHANSKDIPSFIDKNTEKLKVTTIPECTQCSDENEAIWLRQRAIEKRLGIKD